MPDLSQIVQSRSFRNSDREAQRQILSGKDPTGFGSLSSLDQDNLLGRVQGEISNEWWEGEYGASFKRGMAQASSDFAHIAANTAELINEDSDAAKYMRSLSEDLAEDAESPEDRTYAELAAELAGQITVSLPIYAAAIYGAGAGLTAGAAAMGARFGLSKAAQAAFVQGINRYGAPMAVFGTLGGLGHADRGFQDAMTAATKEAAFGALFGGLQNQARIVRASLLGGVAYQMTPEDMDPEERVGHGVTMFLLGGLHAKPVKGGAAALLRKKVEIEVAAKIEGESLIIEATKQFGSEKSMAENLQERLELTKKDAAAIAENVKNLPAAEAEKLIKIHREAEIEMMEGQIATLTASLRTEEIMASKSKTTNIKKQIKRRQDKLDRLKADEEMPSDLVAGVGKEGEGLIEDVSSPRAEADGTGDPSGDGTRGRAKGDVSDVLDPAVERISKASDWRREEYIDNFHGFKWADEQMGNLDTPGNINMSARALKGMAELQDRMITQGLVKRIEDPKRPGEFILTFEGKSFGERLYPILTEGRAYEQGFFQYSHARASRELINQTITEKGIRQSTAEERATLQTREKNWSEEKIREGEALENPTYRKVHEDMVDANNRLMDLAVELDFLTKDQRVQFRRDEYSFGLFREQEIGRTGRHRTLDKLSTALGVPKLHGSRKNSRDELHNYIKGGQDFLQAMLHNQFTRETVLQLDKAGGFGEFIKPSSKRIVVGKEQIRKAIKAELKDIKGLTDKEAEAALKWQSEMPGSLERLAFFIGAGRPYGENIVSFVQKGKPRYFEVKDPVLFRAFESMNPTGRTDMAGRWMANFKDFKQAAITLDPSFIFSNFIRDPMMASIMSRTGHQHLTASLRGLKHVWTNSKEFNDLMANGLGGSPIRNNIAVTRKRLIAKAKADKSGILRPENLLFGPMDMIRWMNNLGRAIELGPRVGEALRARDGGVFGRQGKPAMMKEAVYAGREVSTDFAVRGGGESTDYAPGVHKDGSINFGFHAGPQITRFLGDTVPFFNAMMAGADRGFRAVFRDPHGKAATGLKMGAVGIASTMLYAINRDLATKYAHLLDEDGRPMVDYLNLPDWATTAYWHFYIPTEFDPETKEPTKFIHMHMPKLWEVGMIGTWGEKFAESMYNGTMADKELLFDLIQITAHNFNINTAHKGFPMPLPAGIDTLMEQAMNEILFTGQPIETVGMGKIAHWARARTGQSRAITELGRATRNLDFLGAARSPARAEALLRGIFGNWANMALQLTDLAVFPGGPALGWDDVPVIRRIYSEAGKYDKNTADYYDNLKEFSMAMGTLRDRAKIGDLAVAYEMIEDPDQLALIGMAPGFDRANRKMQLMNREIALLRRGIAEPFATPRERHHMINRVEADRNVVMKTLNDMAKQFKDQVKDQMDREQ